MLPPVRLAQQWLRIEAELPDDWEGIRLRVRLRVDGSRSRAAAVLAPLGPGLQGRDILVSASTTGVAAGPDRVGRALQQLDRERIQGVLELVSTTTAAPRPAEAPTLTIERDAFVPTWDRAVAGLPDDWSDVYAEVDLQSTDYLERTALLLAPVNPARYGGPAGFRFRCARRFGYGASPQMTRRCLQRLDDEGIRGGVRILRALADTKPAYTQGPVWYLGGRSV
jgi:hypothetical protein